MKMMMRLHFFPATDMNEKYPKIFLFQQFLAKMVF